MLKISFITCSDTFYGGIKIPPMSVRKHPQGGIEGISKTLGDYPQAPRRRHLHPTEAAPSPFGGGTFIPWRRHLHLSLWLFPFAWPKDSHASCEAPPPLPKCNFCTLGAIRRPILHFEYQYFLFYNVPFLVITFMIIHDQLNQRLQFCISTPKCMKFVVLNIIPSCRTLSQSLFHQDIFGILSGRCEFLLNRNHRNVRIYLEYP